MKRLIPAALVLLMAAPAAQAACVSFPDTTATNNIQNGTAYMLCLQRELADQAQRIAEEARRQAQLDALRLQLQTQQRLQQMMTPPPITFPSI